MLTTAVPTAAQSDLTPVWLDHLLAMDPDVPWVIWHDADQVVSPLKRAGEDRHWHWLVKNPLWHQEKMAAWIHAWPIAAQHGHWQSLQAIGLLHDAYLSVALESDGLIWVSPQSLAGRGRFPGHDLGWLLGIQSHMQAMVFTHHSATEAQPSSGQGIEVMWVAMDHLPRLNALYWHHFDEVVGAGRLPQASMICQQMARALPGKIQWLPMPTSSGRVRCCHYEVLVHD